MRFVILLAFLGTALAVPKTINRIVGGSPTTVQNYPYMSNMQFGMMGLWWYQACGGSLITSTSVLSAAHCYLGDIPSSWRVLLGTSYSSSGGNAHAVSQLIIHPQYSSTTLDFDIAVVRLANPAVYSNSIQPASIAGSNYALADNTSVVTLGWGSLSNGGLSSEQLQHVTINVVNHNICVERYRHLKSQPGFQNWPDITDGMLCAGILDVGGKAACHGDSGGPVAHGNVVVGVVSWGYGCADPTYPSVNARVSKNTRWIVDNA